METHEETEPAGLRVGYVPGVILTRWRRVWAERLPGVPLEIVAVPEAEQRAALDAGAVDVCFVRLPLDAAGLHLIRLYDELPVAWVARDHPIALYDAITTADLAGEDVRSVPDEDALGRVAEADAVLRVPLSVARSFSRRDLVQRPVTDAPATTVALAWPAHRDNPLIDEFIGIVRGRTANSSRTAQERAGVQGKRRRRLRS
nr:LysR family transcriptional regulator [Propionibacterium sp.]